MEWLDKLRDYVRNLENRDLYKSIGAFFGAILLLLTLTFYLHNRRVKRSTAQLKTLDSLTSRNKEDHRKPKSCCCSKRES